MKLPTIEGFIPPHCRECHEPMLTIIVLPHSNEFCPKCERCDIVYAGHPIQEWCRQNRELLHAETWGELTRSTDVAPFRAMLDRMMLTPERLSTFIQEEIEKRNLRGDPASPGAGRATGQ